MERRKRKQALFGYSIVALILNFAACKDPLTGPFSGDIKEIVPLRVGSLWAYENVYSESDSSTPPETSVVYRKIVGFFDSMAVRYYSVQESSVSKASITVGSHYEILTDNGYITFQGTNKGNPILPQLLLQTPVFVGRRWPRNGVDSVNGYFTVRNIDTTIYVPLTRFSPVITVENVPSRGANGKEFYCFAEGIGIVSEVHQFQLSIFSQATTTKKLLSFH